MAPLKVDTSGAVIPGEGPPTPTHSETQDCIDARKSKHLQRVSSSHVTDWCEPYSLRFLAVNSPQGAGSGVQNISSLQAISSLGNLANLGNGGGLQGLARVQPPLTPSLTPSLANHYREDLTQHVRAFPADILEKQVMHVVLLCVQRQ